jgi:hypothetical protein
MPQYVLDVPLIEIGSRGIPDKSFFLIRDDTRNNMLVELVRHNFFDWSRVGLSCRFGVFLLVQVSTAGGVVTMTGETAQRVTVGLLKGLQVRMLGVI